jgi:Na+-driven multidrug efflux pump
VKWTINWIQKEGHFSDYIQKVINYLLWFLMLIGVIYIIYAWFQILTAAWDEAKVWKSKKIITYVAIWLIIIFLAYSIMQFYFEVLDSGTTWSNATNNP